MRRILLVDIGNALALSGVLPSVALNAAYSAQLSARGGRAPYTYTVSAGTLPAGLYLDPATGIVSGTATAAGTASFTVRATDTSGRSVQRSYAITVIGEPAVLTLTGTFAAATVGTAYTSDLTITNGTAPYTLHGGTGVTSGALPDGLTLSIVGDKLRLNGTPMAAATSDFTVAVDSGDGQTVQSAQSVVVAAGIDWLAQWRLDELSGTAAVDSSGHGYDGLYFGTYTLGNMSLLPSGTGHSYRNDGISPSAIGTPTACTVARGPSFTVLAYCRVSSFTNSPQIYADDLGGAGFVFSSTGRLIFAKTGIEALATDTTALITNTTYMVGMSYDGSTVCFYVNGVRTSTIPLSIGALNAAPTYLGSYRNGYPNNVLSGYLQLVRVANRVLSGAEIAALYATD